MRKRRYRQHWWQFWRPRYKPQWIPSIMVDALPEPHENQYYK